MWAQAVYVLSQPLSLFAAAEAGLCAAGDVRGCVSGLYRMPHMRRCPAMSPSSRSDDVQVPTSVLARALSGAAV